MEDNFLNPNCLYTFGKKFFFFWMHSSHQTSKRKNERENILIKQVIDD